MTRPGVLRPWQRAALVLTPVLVLALFAAVLLDGMARQRASTAVVQATQRRLSDVHELRTRLVDAETGQRGYIITGDSIYLAPYRRAVATIEVLLARVHEGAAGQPATLSVLDQRVRDRLRILELALAARTKGFEAARQQLIAGRGIEAMARLRESLNTLELAQQQRLTRELAAQRAADRRVLLTLALGALATMLASAFTYLVLARHSAVLEQLNVQLTAANAQLQEQAMELELQTQELEMQSEELQAQAVQLEERSEHLQESNRLLEERTEEAEAANAAKTAFLRSMSHELRTPLNAIEGFTDLLELEVHGTLSGPQRACLERVKANSRHLLVLINDVLSFARLETGHIELRSEHIGVQPIIEDVVGLVKPLLDARGIELVPPAITPGLGVQADADRTRQILLNLLGNAARHTGEGTRVELCASVSDGRVTLTVSDTGPGIPTDMQERIFDPFVQVRPANGALTSGVGLGLAISRGLARSMGGELSVRSAPGQGSCFELVLPRSITVTV